MTAFCDQEIIVDGQYINDNPGLSLHLEHPYELGMNMLEVYFNGRKLSNSVHYQEIDSTSILLDLGRRRDGSPRSLQEGDMILIRTWNEIFRYRGNLHCGGSGSGSGNIDETRIIAIEQEISNARQDNNGAVFPTLGARLDDLQRELYILRELIQSGDRVKVPLLFESTVTYETNAYGSIIKEIVSGDFTFEKEYSYTNNRVERERVTYGSESNTVFFEYDEDGYLARKYGTAFAILPVIPSMELKAVFYEIDVHYRIEDGQIIEEQSLAATNYKVTYKYGEHQQVAEEMLVFGDNTYVMYHEYDQNFKRTKSRGYRLSRLKTGCGVVSVPYYSVIDYSIDDLGNILKTVSIGEFTYSQKFTYNEQAMLAGQSLIISDKEYFRDYQYKHNQLILSNGVELVEYGDILTALVFLIESLCRKVNDH